MQLPMASLSNVEKRKLAVCLQMGDGYVLGFSNRTFREFVLDSTGLDIDDPTIGSVGSKATRLRHFWTTQPDHVVGKLLKDLAELGNDPQKQECLTIGERLLQSAPVQDAEVISILSARKEFDVLAKGVLDSIKNNDPQGGLDRLHTFTLKFVRSLCHKHGISADREKPLHSIFGEYVKKLKSLNRIESQMTERILKSSISVLESFNDVRNNQSLAHDNPLLNHNESLLIFSHITSAIRFLWALEQSIPELEPEDIPF
jgi:hypothetical protein